MNKKISVDFHCHTVYSPDSLNDIEHLIKASKARGIERLVITDHNTIRGALLAQQAAPEYVIVGEEIETSDGGEILAAFVKEEVPGRLSYKEAMNRLKEQGTFISLSHPFDYQRKGWQPEVLQDLADVVDAIEIFNSRAMHPRINQQAELFAERFNLAGTAGSDAHTLREAGRARLILPEFSNANELRNIVKEGIVTGVLSSPWIRFSSRWAVWYKHIVRKKLGVF